MYIWCICMYDDVADTSSMREIIILDMGPSRRSTWTQVPVATIVLLWGRYRAMIRVPYAAHNMAPAVVYNIIIQDYI
jgi:hypothetical protein